ncbi:MAG: HhH-GPD-type base excision DNA repair protein [Actinomycetota bacterium]|nr:HhH-GPD-type base excision DNA repair protein [Actinomycetota bacterium]
MPTAAGTIHITGDDAADRLLNTDGTALLVGMLLDQQVPMEWAFAGPSTLSRRLGDGTGKRLDAGRIAAMPVDDFVAICCTKPAIHRFPASMGRRVHELCCVLAAEYRGNGQHVWRGVATGAELLGRLRALPGFGPEKAQIFVAVLGKRMGVQPQGWREAAGKFGDDVPRSVADIHDAASLAVVREWKKAQKAAGKNKQDGPL